MNKKEFYPKKGLYFEHDKFPNFGDWSFAIGFTKQLVAHCMDGYDKPVTHQGFKYELYITFGVYSFGLGYNTVKKVN